MRVPGDGVAGGAPAVGGRWAGFSQAVRAWRAEGVTPADLHCRIRGADHPVADLFDTSVERRASSGQPPRWRRPARCRPPTRGGRPNPADNRGFTNGRRTRDV
jgi:hypothetical protein